MVSPGEGTLADLEAGIDRGILVTSFLGGNANPATGDFSFGVSGFLLEKGKRTQPVGEMNITGNHTELWQRLEKAIDSHNVDWKWVKGHSGVPENERADELARLAIP